MEDRLTAALRALPDRAAPATLEIRVQAELARRAAATAGVRARAVTTGSRPVRSLFIFLSAAAAAFAIALAPRVSAPALFPASLGEVWSRWSLTLGALHTAASELIATAARLLGLLPFWAWAALACSLAMYAALLGLGAAAFRKFSKTD